MDTEFETFEDLDIVSEDGLVMVSLEWIGEGCSGYYSKEDPEDMPLLRFNVFRKYYEGDEVLPYFAENEVYEDDDWMAIQDASYCTALDARADRALIEEAARAILSQVESDARDYQSIKRLCESLSWIAIDKGAVILQYTSPRMTKP